jgi:hypothetical protein
MRRPWPERRQRVKLGRRVRGDSVSSSNSDQQARLAGLCCRCSRVPLRRQASETPVEPRWGRLPPPGARHSKASRTPILEASPAPMEVGPDTTAGSWRDFGGVHVLTGQTPRCPTAPTQHRRTTSHPTPQRSNPRQAPPPALRSAGGTLAQLPQAAAGLILLGDLTGRYATGAYSTLTPDRRTLIPRQDRHGAAEHGHRVTAAIACHITRAGGTLDQLTQLASPTGRRVRGCPVSPSGAAGTGSATLPPRGSARAPSRRR